MMSHKEHEVAQESYLKEKILSAGIIKAMNKTTIKMRAHPNQEGKRSRGTGVGVPLGKGTSEKDWGPRENMYRSSRY